MRWTKLKPIPKIPRWMALKHPGMIFRCIKLLLGKIEIRVYDILLYAIAKMMKEAE